jgi:hypothetical protein
MRSKKKPNQNDPKRQKRSTMSRFLAKTSDGMKIIQLYRENVLV